LFFTEELTDTIRAVGGINDLTQLDLTTLFLTRKKIRIHRSDYLARLKDIVKELGLGGNIKTHAFRKYYMGRVRECKYSLSDERLIIHFEGHEQNKDTDQAYLRMISDIDTYYREWLKTEIAVCVDCIQFDHTNKEILDLKEKNLNLEKQIKIILNHKTESKEKMDDLTNILKDTQNQITKIFSQIGEEMGKDFSIQWKEGKIKSIPSDLLDDL